MVGKSTRSRPVWTRRGWADDDVHPLLDLLGHPRLASLRSHGVRLHDGHLEPMPGEHVVHAAGDVARARVRRVDQDAPTP